MDWLHIGLVVIFVIHTVVFGRIWLRTRKWYHLCLVATFAILIILNVLKAAGAIGPCQASLNPAMALRSAAVILTGAALLGYVRDRKRGR